MKHDKKEKSLSKVITGISDMFMPLMNLLCAGGIMKAVLLILTATSILSDHGETYLILNAISDSTFYFLPVLLAITSAKTFHANPFYSAVIALVLLYPSLTKAFEAGTTLHFFNLPIKAVTYRSSIIPIIMASALLAVTEHFLERILPELVKGFLTPLLCLIIVSLVTLFVFGPIGALIGDALAAGYASLYSFSSAAAGILLGALIQPMVIFGFQWGLIFVAINNIGVTGHDSILPIMAPAVFAQAGAALAVMLKSKNTSFRSLCAPAILSALFGITEPVLFNINLPRKKPFLFGCIGGAVGGLLAGLSKIETPAFVFPSLITLPVYYGDHFMLYLIGCLSGFLIGFFLTVLTTSDAASNAAAGTAPNHIVFDLDGTLIDTENAILKTWRYTLETYGLEYSLENLRIVLGIPTCDALELLNASVDQDFENKWIQNYSKFSDQAIFFPGTEDMLQFMKKSGFCLGVVTSRTKKEYESYFRKFNLEQIFDLIVCSDDTLKHKPNPEPLLYYAKKSGTIPDSCIYIGDMPTDIVCANAAGFVSGLVTWNHSSISEPDADYIFSSPEELLKLCNI